MLNKGSREEREEICTGREDKIDSLTVVIYIVVSLCMVTFCQLERYNGPAGGEED